jgi:SM-20-related protein
MIIVFIPASDGLAGAEPMIPDFERLRATPTSHEPFPHLVVPGFLAERSLRAAIGDFPSLDMPGLFLPEAAPFGPAFGALLDALQGDEMRALAGAKLGIDLAGRPTLATVRAHSQGRDGRIHADSKFKLATALLYLNEPASTAGWSPQGGRLRILRSGDDLDDYAAEVPPDGGLLILFRVQPNSWHGHKPFVGARRYLMINWCQDEAVRDSEAARHRLSGRVKKTLRLFGGAATTDAA